MIIEKENLREQQVVGGERKSLLTKQRLSIGNRPCPHYHGINRKWKSKRLASSQRHSIKNGRVYTYMAAQMQERIDRVHFSCGHLSRTSGYSTLGNCSHHSASSGSNSAFSSLLVDRNVLLSTAVTLENDSSDTDWNMITFFNDHFNFKKSFIALLVACGLC